MDLDDIPDEHKNHRCHVEATGMSKCDVCGRLSGGYRNTTMCYNPDYTEYFRIL